MNKNLQDLCVKCKGRGYCGRPCPILRKIKEFLPKSETHFSGASPPEIFVGRYGYPNINTGILSPKGHKDSEEFSSSEIWIRKNFDIGKILELRGRLIYGQFKSNIKDARSSRKFITAMQEISLSQKPVSTEFFLKKPLNFRIQLDRHVSVIGNPAPLKYVRLEENPKTNQKIEYVSSDNDLKAVEGMKELYKSNISVESIIKLLSAGLLGKKTQRIFVPTRWAITATDDSISKDLLKKIRQYPEISEIQVFYSDYVGNHYEFILLPEKFSLEVIEAKISGSVWNPVGKNTYFSRDYEGFFGRKKYAEEVMGAYYVNRLAVCEYLEKIKKQATVLVLRESRPEYWAPLGVGILREASRKAFQQVPEKFNTVKECFEKIKTRILINTEEFLKRSEIIKNYGKQKKLSQYF